MSETTTEVLTPLEVEIEFRIPRSSQKKARATGSFAPHFRVGRRVYYRREMLEAWVASQEQLQAAGTVADLKGLFPDLGEDAHRVRAVIVGGT